MREMDALPFSPDQQHALRLDGQDELAANRGQFHIPRRDGREVAYFCGNSLGLQPHGAAALIQRELADWAELGVDGHFKDHGGWYGYHELFRESAARLVGGRSDEVVMMNSLTVNLHLMMVSFYRPSPHRHRVLMESRAFPSDNYAVRSQIAHHGYDPEEALVVAQPRGGEPTHRTEDLLELLEREGSGIALVLLGGVQYFTGERFDIAEITRAAHRQGCLVGWDLAHAAGNVPLQLHDDDVDFAVWCSYKYLNAGPGAIAGCFVHQRHGNDPAVPRFAGWWGNDPTRRFRMHLEPDFCPFPGAEGWQLSNPPILAMAPLRASLELFDRVGMGALRRKSVNLTGYLEGWLDHVGPRHFEVLTPREPERRGCQLSLRVKTSPKQVFDSLQRAGVVGDYRPPDVIRIAPVPLYNSFHDVWRFGRAVEEGL